MGTTPVLRGVPMKPAPGRAGRRGPGLVCAPAFAILWPGAGTTGELAWGDVATPLRIVNLNPFQLLYGVPGSLGAHVMARGSSELIASMDMASYLIADSNGERCGDTRPLWITGLLPPDSWRSLRQPGYLQLDQVRTPKHCVWGYDRTLKVRNFRSTKVGNFQSQLTGRSAPGCVQPTGPEPCKGMLMTLQWTRCRRCR